MTAVELLPPGEATPDNPAWHELRRTGITASQIAAVLGISPWESAFSLYWRKVNGWDTDDTDLLSTGRLLEGAVAEWFGYQHLDHWDLRPAGLYAHHERPWQIATPDRLLYSSHWQPASESWVRHYDIDDGWDGLQSALECKWVAYSWDGWGQPGSDDIPTHYRAQALWQADVLDVDEVHIAALGPGGFRAYGPIRRDEDDLKVMRKAGELFAWRLRELVPPDLDSHTATLTTLKRLYPSVGSEAVEVPADLAREYLEARFAKASALARITRCEAEIRDTLRDAFGRATHNGELVASRSVFEQQRIDVARLRAEQPEIAAAYTTKTIVDRLNPGRTSHE